MAEWWYSSIILDLDTRWKWVVSFTPHPLYPPPQRNVIKKRKRIASYGNRTSAVQLVAHHNLFLPLYNSLIVRRYTGQVLKG
jgi:hypothetical protein